MDVVVSLSRSYDAHGKTFDSVTLREPTYRETHMEGLGRPYDWQSSGDSAMRVVFPVVVDSYLQRIVKAPGYECIGLISAIDANRLEKAVCDFFREPTPLSTQPTGSSSGADGATASSE